MAQVIDISAPGQKLSDEEAYPLRDQVAHLLNRSQKGFPGAQPVSFARRHIEELMKQECVVFFIPPPAVSMSFSALHSCPFRSSRSPSSPSPKAI